MKHGIATFKSFLIDGNLGGVHCGLMKEDVAAMLGAPSNWYLKRKDFVTEPIAKFMESSGWHYGYFTVSFDGSRRIDAIVLQVGSPEAELPRWFQGYFPFHNASSTELKRFLKAEQISFHELPSRPIGFALQIGEHTLVKVRGVESISMITYHGDIEEVKSYIRDT